MNLEGTRFPTQICHPGRCDVEIVYCHVPTRTGEVIVDAAPSKDGTIQLRDIGGVRPVAFVLTATQQFGKQGTLHVRHSTHCRKPKDRR